MNLSILELIHFVYKIMHNNPRVTKIFASNWNCREEKVGVKKESIS